MFLVHTFPDPNALPLKKTEVTQLFFTSLDMTTTRWCHWPGTSMLEQRNLSDVGSDVGVPTSGSMTSIRHAAHDAQLCSMD